MASSNQSTYKWYILILGMLTFAVVAGLSRLCMPVLFKAISVDLNLSMVAVGTIWGMDPLAGILVALPGGLLVDRFGIKKTLTVVCLFAGLFGALRGLSFNFVSMAASMFLFGAMAASAPSIVPKAAALWFSGKQLGLANALLNVSWAVGNMSATMFSASVFAVWLGGWRPVLMAIGVPCIVLAVLWSTSGKGVAGPLTDGAAASVKVTLGKALHHVVRIRAVWMLGIIGLCSFGAAMAMVGYLPLYLRNIGWPPALADSAMTVNHGVGVLGIVPIVMLANRLGSPKIVLLAVTMVLAATIIFMPLVDARLFWLVLIVNGLLRSSLFTLFTLIVFEMKSIGKSYYGTALGLMNSIGMLGSFVAPPIGNSLAVISPGAPLIFWGLLTTAAIPFFLFVKDRS